MKKKFTGRRGVQAVLRLYIAGQKAPAGMYRETKTGREFRLEHEAILPATFDGRVAEYVLLPATWSEITSENKEALTEEFGS
jgi:hypothetical protein